MTFTTTYAAAAGCTVLESEAAGDLELFPYIEVVGPAGRGKVLKRDIPPACCS